MFDKLDDILMRLEEVLNQLSEPDVAADAAKFQKLMKEQAELQPIADAYKDYKTQKQTIVCTSNTQRAAAGKQS